ncbi:MAG TPA: thiol reductant ABC exporter subunit CydC, partial [Acidimicrobiales bacterium]|nr:thiol reductant ABC exporter subunit CydC [Acidimicrobiales bacterium]
AVAAGALSSACGIGLLATSGWLITRAATHPPVYVISVAVGAVQAFALGRGVFRYLQRLRVHDLSLRVLGQLRLRLYDDVEPLVPGGLPEDGIGGVLNGFVADADLVAQGLAQGTTAAVDVVASVVLGVLVAALVVPVLAVVLAAGAVAVVGVALAAGYLVHGATVREAQLRSDLATSVIDTVRGARELAAYGRQDLVEERLRSVQRRSMSAAVRQGVAGGIGRAAATWVVGAGLIAVVASGLAVQRTEHLSGVALAVVVFAALATFDQVAGLPAALADTGAATAAARHLHRLSECRPPVTEAVEDHAMATSSMGAALEGAEVAGSDGTILLTDVAVSVAAGRRVALAGRSGAGKTSAVYALLHFVECRRGRATAGGVDVRRMTRSDMARLVGWMAEDSHVFAASVADNLRIARQTASGDECAGALRRVGLGPWLASMPDGLDTALGAGGRVLSAGERQRLGMARALLAGGEVLLLDEPTAHLDRSSSLQVLAELLRAAASRSVLVVSHEPDLERYVDEVVTLDGGRVISRLTVANSTMMQTSTQNNLIGATLARAAWSGRTHE